MPKDREAIKRNKEQLHSLLKEKWRRYMKLFDAKRNLGMMELDEPRRNGWVRNFVLKEESKNRKDADVLQSIVELINAPMYSKERDWENGTQRISKAEWGIPHIENQAIKPLSDKEYEALTPQQKKFFVRLAIRYQTFNKNTIVRYQWCVDRPYIYFKLKDSRHYITHVPILDPDIERESDEIWDWIHTNGLYHKLAKANGWRTKWYDEDYKGKKLSKAILDDMREEVDQYIKAKKGDYYD